MRDDFGAFIQEGVILEPTGTGALSGLKSVVKDVFAIEGRTAGAGNPDWLRTHKPSLETADAIRVIVQHGAAVTGITHTDELMYSLNGQNVHYGTPVNPMAKDRMPGGSSSGSAVAVAAGLADLALGTDTGGSVRIPAAYCGIFGFRPTHGAVSVNGVLPLAPSFDTVGWFAQDAVVLERAGEALITGREDERQANRPIDRIYIPEEAWELTDPPYEGVLESVVPVLQEHGVWVERVQISDHGLKGWAEAFRSLQGCEIWQTHGTWIEKTRPVFGRDIEERFAAAKLRAQRPMDAEAALRTTISQNLESLLGDSGVLLIPTAPGEAPPLGTPEAAMNEWRFRVLQLTCIAGLAGLPQLQIPLESGPGAPIGLSFIAGRDRDLQLLRWVNGLLEEGQIERNTHFR